MTTTEPAPSARDVGSSAGLGGVAAMPVERTLNLFPEVTWDRWTGDGVTDASVFGWLPRDDGRADYVFVMIDADGPWLISTSSAEHSADFAARCGFRSHERCKRVEHNFPAVRSVRLKPPNSQFSHDRP